MKRLLLPLLLLAIGCADETGKSAGDAKVNYLFVQSAASAILKDGTLTLKGVSPTTVYFSDRPQRIAGHVETKSLVEALKEDQRPDSFKNDPPNATLSVLSKDFVDEVVVVLLEPKVNGDEMVYPVKVLEGAEEIEGGPVSLFIDVIGRPLTPVSVAGVHRRHRRRARRHVHHRR